MDYVVIVHPAEEGGYWLEVPSLPGCFAQGETLEDVLDDAKAAITSHLEALSENGQPIDERAMIATVAVPIEDLR
jgi:predicted RNase H-like HicB family nuclease